MAPSQAPNSPIADDVADVCVVGSGPAGVAAVGILLDLGIQSIHWVDPSFKGGRLARYHGVSR